MRITTHSHRLTFAFLTLTLAALVCLPLAPQTAHAVSVLATGAGTTNTLADGTQDQPAASTKSGSKYTGIGGVVLDKEAAKIKNGQTVQFSATLIPQEEGKKIKKKQRAISWKVSNEKVARISQDGVVQGKRTGTVKITATTTNGKKATALVKVKIQKKKIAKKVPILTYHRISTNWGKSHLRRHDHLAISASKFNRQMKWLKKNGYTTISTTELRDWRVEGAFIPKKSVLVTIDDGFFETYYVALPILKKRDQKATSFVIGESVRKKTKKFRESRAWDFVGWDVIKKVRREYPNLEFQSHTYDMHHRAASGNGIVTVLSRSQCDADFRKNAKFGFTALAYPYGHTSSAMLASIRANKQVGIAFGYIMDWPATRKSPLYNMPRFMINGNAGMGAFVNTVKTAR